MEKNQKSIDFINEPESMSTLNMEDITGGVANDFSYVDCTGIHHFTQTQDGKLDVW